LFCQKITKNVQMPKYQVRFSFAVHSKLSEEWWREKWAEYFAFLQPKVIV